MDRRYEVEIFIAICRREVGKRVIDKLVIRKEATFDSEKAKEIIIESANHLSNFSSGLE